MKYTTLLILNQKDISLMVKLDVSAILMAVQVCNILSTIIGNFVYQ
uniref:Unclassified n=3 Tax=Fusarium pseudograminearum TaxID=101028 RepID=W1ICT7_FUSPS|nr:unclassified [Fusarium pseudograminearum CS3220]CDL73193.1 unclassified [Fusarium pseudograminearum CS3487]CDL73288.1 unclassified [Fusarium pseudograminearum CS5834]CDX48226.1 unclassified [Fusarium pseudograminearum CS5834]CDX48318.1 unclassified [Fusarium pseudograminearum CS3487]